MAVSGPNKGCLKWAACGRSGFGDRWRKCGRSAVPLSQEALDGIAVLHINQLVGSSAAGRNMSLGTLFNLTEALEVPPDELLVGYREADGFWLAD